MLPQNRGPIGQTRFSGGHAYTADGAHHGGYGLVSGMWLSAGAWDRDEVEGLVGGVESVAGAGFTWCCRGYLDWPVLEPVGVEEPAQVLIGIWDGLTFMLIEVFEKVVV